MSVPLEQTVTKLFRALEARQIRYAVLRNYELFPSLRAQNSTSPHTDIDLVVDSRDIDGLRGLLTTIAEEDCWDLLTECDHWAQSKTRPHNIEVFRFFRADPLEYLQIDVFHGILVWGLPLADEKEMLDGRIFDFKRRLTRIDPAKENVHRMLQIHGLFPGSRRKRQRYREKLLAYRTTNRERLDRTVERMLSPFGLKAVDALERNDPRSFRRSMRLARTHFLLNYLFEHPTQFPACLYNRLRENIQRFCTRQCGAVIRTSVRDETQQRMVREIMDELVQASFMDEWREHEHGTHLSLSDYKEMEQGCLIVEWRRGDHTELDLRNLHDKTETLRAILDVCSRRHKQLYLRGCGHDIAFRAEASAS